MRARTFSNFGMSGAMKWYFGQHAKVCSAMKNRDLKQAIQDAAALNDLGIQGKTYEEVIQSPELLTDFKKAFNGFKGKMPSYDDETIAAGNELLDEWIADATNPVSIDQSQEILQATKPIPEPEPSFLEKNSIPLLIGGAVIVLAVVGLLLLIRV
jgi:hypothetical protein